MCDWVVIILRSDRNVRLGGNYITVRLMCDWVVIILRLDRNV